jgi:hypothetical protein
MTTAFTLPINSASTTLAASHAIGSGTLVLTDGSFLPSGVPSTATPIRVTCIRLADFTSVIFKVTAISGNTISGLTAIEGSSDITLNAGDVVDMRITAGYFVDIHNAINAIQAGGGGGVGSLNATSPLSYNSGTQTLSIDLSSYATQSYVAGQGFLTSSSSLNPASISAGTAGISITGNAATITGSVTQTQVTGLGAALALLAPLASPTLTGVPAAPTATAGTNTTQIATTAFVLGQGFLTTNAVTSVAGKIGAVTLVASDVGAMGGVGYTVPGYTVSSGVYVDSSGNLQCSAALTATAATTATNHGNETPIYHYGNVLGGGPTYYAHSDTYYRGPTVNFARSGGTQGSPTATLSTQYIGNINWSAYNGTSYSNVASIYVRTTSTQTTGNGQSQIRFDTTSYGSASLTDTLIIDSGFCVRVGSDTGLSYGDRFQILAADSTNKLLAFYDNSTPGNLLAYFDHSGVFNGNITGTASGLSANIAESQVTNLTSDLSAKAPIASPTFTGTPSAPTAANGTNTTQIATTAFVIANGGTGTVTSVSVATANGLSGSSSGGATPALTLGTTLTGMIKGNGSAFLAASAGSDYPGLSSANTFTAANIFQGTTGSAAATFKSRTGAIATITTSAAHGFSAGSTVLISGSDTDVSGTWVIYQVPTSTTFTFCGTVSGTLASTGISLTCTSGANTVQFDSSTGAIQGAIDYLGSDLWINSLSTGTLVRGTTAGGLTLQCGPAGTIAMINAQGVSGFSFNNNTASLFAGTGTGLVGMSGSIATGVTSVYSYGGGSVTLSHAGTTNLTSSTSGITFSTATKQHRTAVSASTYTCLTTDYLIGVTSTSSAVTITLDAVSAGRVFIVKDESGGAATHNITVKGAGSTTIDGVAASTGTPITTNYGVLRVYSDGTNWFTW